MRKENIKYALLQMAFWTAAASCYAFMTQILEAKGFGGTEIGILNGGKLFATVFFQMLIGSFADRHGKKIPLKVIIGLLSGAAAVVTAVFYFRDLSFAGTMAVFVGYGASFMCISPLMDSLSVIYNSRGVKINYAFGRAAGSAAYAAASVAFGVFCEKFGSVNLLLVQLIFLLLILAAVLSFGKMPEPPVQTEKEKKQEEVHSAWYLLRNYPQFCCFLLGSAVMFMGYNLGTTFLIHVIEGLGGSNIHYGAAEFVMAISEVPAAFIMIRCRHKVPMEKLMISCAFFMTLKNVFAAYSGNVTIIILSQTCEMLGFGMYYSGSVYLVEDMLPKADVVKAMSFVNAATIGLGEGLGSLFCGYIRDSLGLENLMRISVVTGIISVICMVLMNLLPKERIEKTEKKQPQRLHQ